MFTEDALQPYTDGLEIKTDDQRLADVSTDCLAWTRCLPLPVTNWNPDHFLGLFQDWLPMHVRRQPHKGASHYGDSE